MSGRAPRFKTKGQVYISKVVNTEALLKNLSMSGLCIQSSDFMDILPKNRYSVDIVPEKGSNIDRFSLEIESRWVKTKMKSNESGFVIVVPPGTSGETLLERYLHFLASQPGAVEEENEKNS